LNRQALKESRRGYEFRQGDTALAAAPVYSDLYHCITRG